MHFAGQPMSDAGELFAWMGDVPVVDGAIAHVACTLYAEHPAGDHTLYLGEVIDIADRPGDPLLFHSGLFGTMSREPALAEGWGW